MAVIGDKTIERIKDHIGALCEAYIAQIDEAYLNAENDLKVNFTAHLTPGKAVDDIIVETGISFVATRVKDRIEDVVNERQGTLFGPGGGIESVTFRSGEKEVTLSGAGAREKA